VPTFAGKVYSVTQLVAISHAKSISDAMIPQLMTMKTILLGGFLIGNALSCTSGLAAEHNWGGSVGLTSDFLVRGISRSDHQASLQAEVHIANKAGWMAGVFAASTRLTARENRDAELGGFVGYAWNWNSDWSSKLLASYYSYPWNDLGSAYDYSEFSAELGFRGWLSVSAVYSPDAWRYWRQYGLFSVEAKSVEVNLQSPAWRKLTFNAGAGYSDYSGVAGGGYSYWSAGASYDLAPVTATLGFVDSSSGAKRLFYDNAAQHRWMAALIWRF
jgi:uncharacterized protein (TIGR02001 family)